MTRFPLCAALAVLVGCSRPQPLPVFGAVPDFVLTSQTGGRFDSKSLHGKVWVADFMFTTCMGPCPRMSSQMHWIQTQTAALPDVRLVSFTIDPERDTPPVLTAYARRFRAEAGRWFFLTGPASALQNLNRNAFKLGDIDGTMTHSTRFVLVDRRGRIRGYYRTEEGESLEPLAADIQRLVKEQS
jgi:protein SCO1